MPTLPTLPTRPTRPTLPSLDLAGAPTVRPVGRAVLLLGLLGVVVALVSGWLEFGVLGLACLVVLVLALPFLAGRASLEVVLTLEPQRVTAGDSVVAGLAVRNVATGRMSSSVLEVPVGNTEHRFQLGSLAAGATEEESFTIRTERRGVIPVGPVRTRRGDPLGLLARDVSWTELSEVLVRPPLVPLSSIGSGLLRDLEGISTDAVSQSDLAFHTLREYVPGDDLRHVHWRSSAKAMAGSGSQALLVRQYLDTRRSHASVVVDDRAGVWQDPDDFETAMSVAASILVQALSDEFDVSFVCGEHLTVGADGRRALDAVCRAVRGDDGLVTAARRAAGLAPDASLAFLVTGAATEFIELQRAASAFPPEVRRIGIVVDGEQDQRLAEAGGMPLLYLSAKEDLGALLRGSVR